MLLMKALELFAEEHKVDNLMDCLTQYAEETNMDYKQFNRLSKAIHSFNLKRQSFSGNNLYTLESNNSDEQKEPSEHDSQTEIEDKLDDDFEDDDFEDDDFEDDELEEDIENEEDEDDFDEEEDFEDEEDEEDLEDNDDFDEEEEDENDEELEDEEDNQSPLRETS